MELVVLTKASSNNHGIELVDCRGRMVCTQWALLLFVFTLIGAAAAVTPSIASAQDLAYSDDYLGVQTEDYRVISPSRHVSWSPTVGFYYLKPTLFMFTDNFEFTWDYSNYEFVPMVLVDFDLTHGYRLRTKLWTLSTDTDVNRRFDDSFNERQVDLNLHARVGLEMDVWDGEVAVEAHHKKWNLLISGGMRYAGIQQQYDASTQFEIDENGSAQMAGDITFHYRDDFAGLGPTFALDMVRPVATSRFDVFLHARGSAIVGERDKRFRGRVDPSDTVDAALRTTAVSALENSSIDVVPVAELELGIAWNKNVAFGQMYCRVGVVAQAWSKAIDLSEISSLAQRLDPFTTGDFDRVTDELASLKKDHIHGLVGLVVAAGFIY